MSTNARMQCVPRRFLDLEDTTAMIARLVGVAGLCVLLTAVACTPSPPNAALPILRIGYAGEPDFGDLPSLIAQSRLRARGIDVQVTNFGASDLAIEAVARGSMDVIHASMIGAWTAASRGAPIRTVMDHVANPYRFVAVPDVATCADLDGRRVAIAGESSISTHLVRGFLAEECPSIHAVEVSLTESTGRAAAILAGGIDAAALDLNVLMWLEQQAPGRFTVLSDLSTRWPLVRTTGVHVNVGFASTHADVVRSYMRELLHANRDARTRADLLVAEAERVLGPSADWAAVAKAYQRANMWPEDGGLNGPELAHTLAFFKHQGALPAEMSADAVVDRQFLEDVVAAGEQSQP